MELLERELDQMARLYAKRFPTHEQRVSLASQVGLGGLSPLIGDPFRAWREMLRLASNAGRLPALCSAASRRHPEDPNLADLAGIASFGERLRVPSRQGALLVQALAAGLLVSLGFALGRCTAGEPVRPSTRAAVSIEETTPDAGRLDQAAPLETRAEGGVESPAPAANTATLPASGSTRPDLSYLSSLPSGEEYDPREAERFVRGPCGGPGGQIVGWWYAREGAPAEVGETYVMTRPANVRKGSPKAENGWKNDGPVVCSLHKGDRALLRRAPVGNGVHGLWIPVVAGDLLERR